MDYLFQYSNQLIEAVDTSFQRYLYPLINWNNRMLGIIGPRGIGKTTLVLQHIKNHLDRRNVLYVTAEDFYFANHQLIDLAREFAQQGGQYLFIDEIHKYPYWSKELKLIYDYHPQLHIVFTGSSILEIKKGSSDLSRRAVVYNMQGLSFREYLELFHQMKVPIYTLEQILNHEVATPLIPNPLPLFQDYLIRGYYPFSREPEFQLKLQQVIIQTLEQDIPAYAQMNISTGRKLKRLMAVIAQSVPFKPNMSKLSELLSISRNIIGDYLFYMEDAGMIGQLRSATGGIRSLGKVDKVYLDNTNIIYNLVQDHRDKGNLRETFFYNQVKLQHPVFSAPVGDFKVRDIVFEVGGKEKSIQQIKNIEQGYLVKDDLITGYLRNIPLWHFGLMY